MLGVMSDIPHTVMEETDRVKICKHGSACYANGVQAALTHVYEVVVSSIDSPHDGCKDERGKGEDDEVDSVRSHGINFASSFEHMIAMYL